MSFISSFLNPELRDKLWENIERIVGEQILPLHLKNLLFITGFDSITAIKCITNDSFRDVEVFAQTTLTEIIKSHFEMDTSNDQSNNN